MREKIAILPSLYDFGGSMDESKKWYVQFSVRDPRTGVMVRKKLYSGLHVIKNKAARYREAEKIIQEYTELLKTGWNPLVSDEKSIYTDQLQYRFAAKVYQDKKAENRTVNFFINKYMRERMSGLDPNTIGTYTSKYRIFQQWVLREDLADKDITTFNKGIICMFFTYLNEERKSSHITYKKYKQLIWGLFDYLVDTGVIYYNPVQGLPKCNRVVSKEPAPIRDGDVRLFMEQIKENEQMYLFILFEYYCLMRPNEIRLMQVKWIDFARGIIFIPSEISKTRRPKSPIIPDVLMELLREKFQLHFVNKDYYVIGKNGKPGSEHIGKNTMRNRFNKVRTNLKMPTEYMLYSWKHTANVRLEDSNTPTIERMHQNGHTSIATTERYTRNKAGFKSIKIKESYPELK